MMQQFGQFQSFAKDAQEAVLTSANAVTRGFQSVASEATEYAKRSFDQGTAVGQKLVGARTIDRAIEIQGDYARTAYEGFVAQATKVGEIMQTTARDAFAPLGGLAKRAVPTA